jgi:hypothetical protein
VVLVREKGREGKEGRVVPFGQVVRAKIMLDVEA